jgi:hypothetical protein
MTSVLTVNSQVTISTPIRDFLGCKSGERLRFESLPNGRAAKTRVDFAKANASKTPCPFAQFRGTDNTGMTTDEPRRMTRGNDWNQPQINAVLGDLLKAASIHVEPLSLNCACLAGQAFLAYRQRKGAKTGVLPNFFIGAQAQSKDWTRLTRGSARRHIDFPIVKLGCLK